MCLCLFCVFVFFVAFVFIFVFVFLFFLLWFYWHPGFPTLSFFVYAPGWFSLRECGALCDESPVIRDFHECAGCSMCLHYCVCMVAFDCPPSWRWFSCYFLSLVPAVWASVALPHNMLSGRFTAFWSNILYSTPLEALLLFTNSCQLSRWEQRIGNL